MCELPNNIKKCQRIQWCKDSHLLDKNFGEWWDRMIIQGYNEWAMCDTMTCDDAEPCKEAKFPDSISPPLEYMKHHKVFDPKKINEYDLCCFY